MTELRTILENVWDDGNAIGLDGWVGPGRGTEPVDDHAIRGRHRAVEAAMAALSVREDSRRDRFEPLEEAPDDYALESELRRPGGGNAGDAAIDNTTSALTPDEIRAGDVNDALRRVESVQIVGQPSDARLLAFEVHRLRGRLMDQVIREEYKSGERDVPASGNVQPSRERHDSA